MNMIFGTSQGDTELEAEPDLYSDDEHHYGELHLEKEPSSPLSSVSIHTCNII